MPIATETTLLRVLGVGGKRYICMYTARCTLRLQLVHVLHFSAALRALSLVPLELIPAQDGISRSAHDSSGRRK